MPHSAEENAARGQARSIAHQVLADSSILPSEMHIFQEDQLTIFLEGREKYVTGLVSFLNMTLPGELAEETKTAMDQLLLIPSDVREVVRMIDLHPAVQTSKVAWIGQ